MRYGRFDEWFKKDVRIRSARHFTEDMEVDGYITGIEFGGKADYCDVRYMTFVKKLGWHIQDFCIYILYLLLRTTLVQSIPRLWDMALVDTSVSG